MNKKTTINFEITKSNHIIIECKVNSINGKFIIDTGASNSCIDYLLVEKFNLSFKKYNEQASSATNQINETFFSKKNNLEIAGLIKNNFEIVLFDMSHINNSFNEKNIDEIDGIIGGDILMEFNANINYLNKKITLKL